MIWVPGQRPEFELGTYDPLRPRQLRYGNRQSTDRRAVCRTASLALTNLRLGGRAVPESFGVLFQSN